MDIVNNTLKEKKRRRLRMTVAAVAAGVVLLGGLIWSLGPALPQVDRSSLWIGTVQRNDMLLEVRASGTLVPRSSRWLAAATAAQVQEILVQPGTVVKADTVLMRLSNPEVEDNLRNAQAEATAAEADVEAKRAELASTLLDRRTGLAQAQVDYASAQVKFEADTKAVELKLISQVQYDQGQIVFKQLGERVKIEQERVNGFFANMKAQMEAVNARADQQRSTLILRQRQADALNVKAGIDGVLQEVVVQEGVQVSVGTNLARVARPDVLIARLQVSELQAKDVAMGMPVTVDTHNGTVEGKVERIDPAVRSGSVQVDVTLTGALPHGARPDLSVDGRIRISLLRNVLSVGRPALAQPNGDSSLFRLDASGKVASRVPVKLGAVSVDRVQVVRGLQVGDQIILSDASQWDKYDRIRVK
ncbi:RND family efflux transporter, MFP subunit [Lysobacter sp. yr284]|uniref:efflux RND transporter periplasmic adaptor subunit n=1 Tax=Lysobacter sp. yr284 TaxID=1761791 RepID=UPI00089BA3F2|nr:HlyD family efflux transporter periplasmic adaptor subunit [Lysobacter sp. yr284]SDZ17746.1 RND family efflux transporter, MFP subunit [Lysobacter sp. yr284]